MLPNLDPNIIYVILFTGLWVGITAAYMPGTGIIELVSIGIVAFAIFALTTLSVNWWALVLIIIGGVGFLAMPFIERRTTLLAIVGLALQAIGSLFLFQQTPVSPLLVIACVGIVLLYHQLALRPALERNRTRSVVDEDSGVIGARGRVVTSLNPVGAVQVRGESWSARSDQTLEIGDEVQVVERDGLMLYVEALKHKNDE